METEAVEVLRFFSTSWKPDFRRMIAKKFQQEVHFEIVPTEPLPID